APPGSTTAARTRRGAREQGRHSCYPPPFASSFELIVTVIIVGVKSYGIRLGWPGGRLQTPVGTRHVTHRPAHRGGPGAQGRGPPGRGRRRDQPAAPAREADRPGSAGQAPGPRT